MKSFFTKDIVGHPIIIASLVAVGVIAAGSAVYYVVETRLPGAHTVAVHSGPISEVVTGTGTVEPAQNPDLAFQSGGRVAAVSIAVGQHVYQGQLLASLDTGTLAANKAQAEANLKAQQANLDALNAGPRATDVSAKQTAIAQAQQALDNLYTTVPSSLTDAYDKTYSAVRADTDSLFSDPTTVNAKLVFSTTDSQVALNTVNARITLNNAFVQWNTDLTALNSNSSPATLEAALAESIAKLEGAREYSSDLNQALAGAVPSASFSESTISADQAAVGTLVTSINTLILSLKAQQQQLANAKLAVQSAQDALAQVEAGATPQDVEAQQAQVEAAQAQLQGAEAQLSQAVVVAPFAGTVTSINVKPGEIVPPNTVAVSITPQSALQVAVSLSEIDIAKLAVGNQATITLDAFGSGRVFPATVVSVDRSPEPSANDGGPTYKATLQFTKDDPSIAVGMTANVTITAGHKDSALLIPRSAVITEAGKTFVLTPSAHGPIQKEITLGLSDDANAEVLSGLSEGGPVLVTAQ